MMKSMSSPPDSVTRAAAAALAAAVAFTAARPVWAVACNTLPSPIYGIGASAPKPLFAKYATALTNASPPQTLVYQYPGACYGPNGIINATPMTGTASYWDAAG